MKVFEETFGIDKLQTMVTKVGEKIDDVSNIFSNKLISIFVP